MPHAIVPSPDKTRRLLMCQNCLRILVGDRSRGCQACEGTDFLQVLWTRHCRKCGCHAGRVCHRKIGHKLDLCVWVGDDLCSFCEERELAAGSGQGREERRKRGMSKQSERRLVNKYYQVRNGHAQPRQAEVTNSKGIKLTLPPIKGDNTEQVRHKLAAWLIARGLT